jgi:hypothetical protein
LQTSILECGFNEGQESGVTTLNEGHGFSRAVNLIAATRL